MNYPLEERTLKFSENVINLCKKIENNHINAPIINQLIRAGTSIGANYSEANGASSKKDFRNKIYICKKESQETRYWLKLMISTNSAISEVAKPLLQEAHEFCLIFGKINSTANKKSN